MKLSSRPQFTEADRVWDLVVVGGGTAGWIAVGLPIVQGPQA